MRLASIESREENEAMRQGVSKSKFMQCHIPHKYDKYMYSNSARVKCLQHTQQRRLMSHMRINVHLNIHRARHRMKKHDPNSAAKTYAHSAHLRRQDGREMSHPVLSSILYICNILLTCNVLILECSYLPLYKLMVINIGDRPVHKAEGVTSSYFTPLKPRHLTWWRSAVSRPVFEALHDDALGLVTAAAQDLDGVVP
jgi:hypothetical protein